MSDNLEDPLVTEREPATGINASNNIIGGSLNQTAVSFVVYNGFSVTVVVIATLAGFTLGAVVTVLAILSIVGVSHVRTRLPGSRWGHGLALASSVTVAPLTLSSIHPDLAETTARQKPSALAQPASIGSSTLPDQASGVATTQEDVATTQEDVATTQEDVATTQEETPKQCEAGTIECIDRETVSACIENRVTLIRCAPGETCDPAEGCRCSDACILGATRCKGPILEECKRTDLCTEWIATMDCAATNRTCHIRNGSPQCTNECGGLEILEHSVCDYSADMPCGAYYCDSPNSVALDHVSCLPGGARCRDDNECASCNCAEATDGKYCIGDTLEHCPETVACL